MADQVEGVALGLGVVAPAMQRVEIGDPAGIQHHDLAVDRETHLAHLARGLGDEG